MLERLWPGHSNKSGTAEEERLCLLVETEAFSCLPPAGDGFPVPHRRVAAHIQCATVPTGRRWLRRGRRSPTTRTAQNSVFHSYFSFYARRICMEKIALRCDVCNGSLTMQPGGQFAICDYCGT